MIFQLNLLFVGEPANRFGTTNHRLLPSEHQNGMWALIKGTTETELCLNEQGMQSIKVISIVHILLYTVQYVYCIILHTVEVRVGSACRVLQENMMIRDDVMA